MAKISKNIAKARAAVTKPAYPLPEAVTLLSRSSTPSLTKPSI